MHRRVPFQVGETGSGCVSEVAGPGGGEGGRPRDLEAGRRERRRRCRYSGLVSLGSSSLPPNSQTQKKTGTTAGSENSQTMKANSNIRPHVRNTRSSEVSKVAGRVDSHHAPTKAATAGTVGTPSRIATIHFLPKRSRHRRTRRSGFPFGDAYGFGDSKGHLDIVYDEPGFVEVAGSPLILSLTRR